MTEPDKKIRKALLSNKLTKKLLTEEKPYRVYDTEIKGFIARVLPTGKIGYYYEYRNEAGRNKSYYIGRHGDITADQARETAQNMSADKTKGVDVQAVKKMKHKDAKEGLNRTLLGFIDSEYEQWAKAHLATGTDAIKRIKQNFPHLLNTQIEDITTLDLVKWRTGQIIKGKCHSTINRDVTCLKSVLSKAKEWKFVTLQPLNDLKPLKIDSNPITRYLSDEEGKRLFEALDAREEKTRADRANGNKWRAERGYELFPEYGQYFVDYLKPMVLISMYTGLRRSELLNLKWEEVNLEAERLTVVGKTAKNKTTRHIPLHSDLVTLLKQWQAQTTNTGHLFTNSKGEQLKEIKKTWDRLLKKAKIENFRWHDLRHDFASKLVTQSVDLNTVRELLGHSDIRMTLRYAHLAPEHMTTAINKLKAISTGGEK